VFSCFCWVGVFDLGFDFLLGGCCQCWSCVVVGLSLWFWFVVDCNCVVVLVLGMIWFLIFFCWLLWLGGGRWFKEI
jgi:hypothetical protein